MIAPSAEAIVPADADLPGAGWLAIDEGFSSTDDLGAAGELLDCVGPAFPEDEVVGTAASPHFVRPPGRLLHGIGVAFATEAAADVATGILGSTPFVECLSRSVAADLAAQPIDAELLGIDVERTPAGHRVRFTGGDEHGVRPVHLDIAVVRSSSLVGLLWCGDTPEPFPDSDRDHVIGRVRRRVDG